MTRSLVALLTVAAASGLAADAPRLLDPGFEQVDEATGYPLHWEPVWRKPTTCAYTLACAHSGAAAALITDASDKESHGLRSAKVKIAPGQWYEASVFVRIPRPPKGGFALYLEFWNRAGLRILNKSIYTAKPGDWRALKVRAQAPTAACAATLLIYGSSATIGTAYFDDAAFVKIDRKGAKHARKK